MDGDLPVCMARQHVAQSLKRDAQVLGPAFPGTGQRKRSRGSRSSTARDVQLLSHRNVYRAGSATTLFQAQDFHVLFFNIQGLKSHLPELSAFRHLAKIQPSVVCLNETFLDESIGEAILEGYDIVSRRDRKDGRKAGGVAVYALRSISDRIAEVEKSDSSDRVWLVLHADTGPYLIGVWYRPSDPGEIDSIKAFDEQRQRLSVDALGSILVGDLNVHHVRWLRYSSRNSTEGELLRNICDSCSLRQLVREPTRGDNMLDLALADLDEVRCKVVSKIADHKGLELTLPI